MEKLKIGIIGLGARGYSLLESVLLEFDEIEKCQSGNRWEESGEILGKAAKGIEAAGADFILICTNTMHKVAPQIASMIQIPIIHIADATADELDKCHIKRVGLLGTKYTMTQDFYKKRLTDRGIEVLIPDEADVETVNTVIFDELCVGKIREESRKEFQRIIEKLKEDNDYPVVQDKLDKWLLTYDIDKFLKTYPDIYSEMDLRTIMYNETISYL